MHQSIIVDSRVSRGMAKTSDKQRSCYDTNTNMIIYGCVRLSCLCHSKRIPTFLMSFLLHQHNSQQRASKAKATTTAKKEEEEEIKTFVWSLIKIVMVILDDGTNKICNENEFILHYFSFLFFFFLFSFLVSPST